MQVRAVANSRLYVESIGEGQPVVILHGWGMHGGLFQSLAATLSDQHAVHLVDLPGHGFSEPVKDFSDIDAVSDFLFDELADVFRQSVTLVGWSMGGLLAQALAAKFPDKINKLALIAATPCFTKRPDWQHGVQGEVLNQFANGLISDYQDTLGRFLAIQFMGSENQKQNLRAAKQKIFARPSANPSALEQGLELLDKTDLRKHISMIQCPTLILNGERDSLVPPMSARFLAEQLSCAQACILKGAGHAAFLSHEDKFNELIKSFLDD